MMTKCLILLIASYVRSRAEGRVPDHPTDALAPIRVELIDPDLTQRRYLFESEAMVWWDSGLVEGGEGLTDWMTKRDSLSRNPSLLGLCARR
jgi:hypothetical protein